MNAQFLILIQLGNCFSRLNIKGLEYRSSNHLLICFANSDIQVILKRFNLKILIATEEKYILILKFEI